jgi:hypothetical protein
MDYSKAVERLWNHANLPQKLSQLTKEESFCYSMWQAEQTKQPINTDSFYSDIMQCLEAVNRALNTDKPSESIEGKAEAIDRKICYSVSQILSIGWLDYYRWAERKTFPETPLRNLAGVLVKIGMAWDLILAGDIDEIQLDAEGEFQVWNSP